MTHGRLHWYEPHELDEAQRALYDEITTGQRAQGPQAFDLTDSAGRLHGPFNAFLLAPDIGRAVAELGSAIRYRSSLSNRAREIAILELAALRRSEFEWYAHARVGAAAGLTQAELTALRTHAPCASFGRRESLVRAVVHGIVLAGKPEPDIVDSFESEFGQSIFMELIVLVGYYDLLATSLRVWQTPLPGDAQPAFDSSE